MRPFKNATTLPLLAHGASAIATIGFFQWIKGRLDSSYAASNHPVDYFTGQTSFNGPAIKGYYAQMQELGTLDIYVRTQIIDFGFIAAMICVGLFVCTLLGRLSREGSFGRRAALVGGLSLVIGALCDAIENAISFVMLTNPASFPDWLALPYSGFASVKFACVALAMLCAIVSLICAISGRILRKPAVG